MDISVLNQWIMFEGVSMSFGIFIIYYNCIVRNKITSTGAKASAESLKVNTSIHLITLGNLYKILFNIYIDYHKIGIECSTAISESLKVTYSIYLINLDNV